MRAEFLLPLRKGSAGQKSMALPTDRYNLRALVPAAHTNPVQLLGCVLVSCYPFPSGFNYFCVTGGFS